MDQIIDVEYKEVMDLDSLSNEELCREVNLYWNQMEALGRLGLEFAAMAGRRLNIIKSRLQHGEWEDWAKENLVFSLRKANRMMKLAEKMGDENSLFFKNDNLTDIGISKVWALLGAPEDVAEEVIKNPQAQEMSVKEFQDEIRRLKEKNANLEDTVKKTAEENTAIEITLRSRIKELEVDLENHKEANPKVLEMMTTEMKKLRVKLEKEKERVKKLKDSTDAEKEKAAAEARAAAEEEARKNFEQETKSLQESNQEAAAEIDRLTRKLANSFNSEMASFKAYADQLQKAFGACVTSIGKVETEDQQQAAKMRDALRSIMESLVESI